MLARPFFGRARPADASRTGIEYAFPKLQIHPPERTVRYGRGFDSCSGYKSYQLFDFASLRTPIPTIDPSQGERAFFHIDANGPLTLKPDNRHQLKLALNSIGLLLVLLLNNLLKLCICSNPSS